MKKLIFNADDFGYSYGVNYGIIESHLRECLSSRMRYRSQSHIQRLG